jgi:hypothetical protein
VKQANELPILKNSFKFTEEFPKLDAEAVIAFLSAHFTMARMYGKTIETSVPNQLASLEKSRTHYEYIVNYVQKYQLDVMKQEVEICKEMIALMPGKMEALMRGYKI